MSVQEDIKSLVAMLPVWDSSIWEPLQQKKFKSAEEQLIELFRNFEPADWGTVQWKLLFVGAPAIRGELSPEEWGANVVPLLVRAIFRTANGKVVAQVLQSLPLPAIQEFLGILKREIAETSFVGGFEGLKTSNPSLYLFLSTAPSQELGVNFIEYPKELPRKKVEDRFIRLMPELKAALFSYEYAEIIFRASQKNHLSEEKTTLVARLVGRTLMGFVHLDDFTKALRDVLLVDTRISDAVTMEITQKIFSKLTFLIQEAYEPEVREELLPTQRETVNISFSPTTSRSSPRSSSSAPFVLHEEKSVAGGERKDSMRGFSLPFGLFKPKAPDPITSKASVETPKQVHYSEYRTSLAPGAGGEFINLETFGKTSATPMAATPLPVKAPITAPPTTAAPTLEATLQIKKTQAPPLPARTQPTPTKNESSPKVEGNTVDLR